MADWQAGDLALCVRGGFIAGNPEHPEHPVQGRLYTVSAVVSDGNFVNGAKLGLLLASGPANICGEPVWGAGRFIKVTPPSDMKAEPRAKAKPEQMAG